jgi:putative colanic acid biosynthesis acetyltransferase WcaB
VPPRIKTSRNTSLVTRILPELLRMKEVLRLVLADWKANKGNFKGRLIMLLFRICHHCSVKRKRKSPLNVFRSLLILFYHLFVEWLLGVELQEGTTVGAGLRLCHGQALVVNENASIGNDCLLRQSTTIGCVRMSDGSLGPSPVIGDRVDVGANVVILGGVTIHNGARIGAGSVVVHDVPENAVVVGNPARVISFIPSSAERRD